MYSMGDGGTRTSGGIDPARADDSTLLLYHQQRKTDARPSMQATIKELESLMQTS